MLTVLIILCNHKPIIVWLLSLCLVHCQQFHSCYIDFSIWPSTDTKIGSTIQRTPWKFIIIINDRYGKHDIMHTNRMNIKYFRLNVSVCPSLSFCICATRAIYFSKKENIFSLLLHPITDSIGRFKTNIYHNHTLILVLNPQF